MKALRRTTALITACVVGAWGHGLSAQKAPTFDVVSIKANQSADLDSRVSALPSGRFVMTNVPLSAIVLIAFELQDTFQVDGLPDWTQRERFDVEAQAPKDVPIAFPGQGTALPAMLRAMLVDRMKLVTHVETRSMPMLALVLARSDGALGPHLVRSSVDCTKAPLAAPAVAGEAALVTSAAPSCGNRVTATSFAGKGIPLDRVIRMIIAPRVRRQIVDRTGLTGTFDLDLQFRAPTPAEPTPGATSDLPTIEEAVQEQLGLKLQSIREPSDVLVIDRIARPTAN